MPTRNSGAKVKLQTWCTLEEFELFKKKAEERGLKVAEALRMIAGKFAEGEMSIELPEERLSSLEKEVCELRKWKEQADEIISRSLGELAA